jgi:hypothetical protein
MALLMPTSSPLRLISAPPELPGLMEASVWMKFSYLLPMPERPSALTMPEVTVWRRPKGLPMATTKSPTCSWSESAIGRACRLSALICSTATSVSGSLPTILATISRSSASLTVTLVASATTWLLVMM